MCGIVGYTGVKNAVDILLEGLSNLEYRGYDSAGISVLQNGIQTIKTKGRLSVLAEKVEDSKLFSHCGIGHTRWATHGEPSDINSHPHFTSNLSLVHNGIIENYLEIKTFLIENGYQFISQTDTETAANLMDFYYNGDPIDAIIKTCQKIEGSYAFAVVFKDFPDHVYGVRKDSPLIVAKGDNENFLASDMTAVLKFTNQYYLLEEKEIADITQDTITFYNQQAQEIKKDLLTATWSVEQAQKGGYEHFMLKEIMEQPRAFRDTVSPRIVNGIPHFSCDGLPEDLFKRYKKINIVACGTAMYAGLLGKYIIEKVARIPVETEVASEFRYRDPLVDENSLVIIISQSGETADSLAALRLAKAKGAATLAIVNVAGSSIDREALYCLHTFAGPEIAVASTKAYTVQIATMYLIAIHMAHVNGIISDEGARKLTGQLVNMEDKIAEVLQHYEDIKDIAKNYKDTTSLFFIGRGPDYPLAMEGSLKLKEISYIHCEAYPAGELKHGPISLITDGVPVIALATQSTLLNKTVSNIKEVKARGANVLLLAKSGHKVDPGCYDNEITLPAVEDLFMPLVSIVPMQLIGYYSAIARGCDVDKPRNLAKSVTVE